MRVTVFGLGYVGCVTMVALASEGVRVTGIDTDQTKLVLLRRGLSPIKEPGLEERIPELLGDGRIRLTEQPANALEGCDLAFVCVGTPSADHGSPSLEALEWVSEDIAQQMRQRSRYLSVVYRSTVLPGTVEDHLIPLLERVSGRSCAVDFGVGYNPEFMREGTGLADFYRPARIIIGEVDRCTADRLQELYSDLEAPLVREPVRLAEMIKYADNAFHSLKIGFANEIGSLADRLGVDGRRLMEVFCLDTRLNLSPAYLRPGFAFGGSCLPKDLRALTSKARDLGVATPILESILPSNRAHLERALKIVEAKRRGAVGVIGLTFKEDTDDLRESPALDFVAQLRAAKTEVRIFDLNLRRESLLGSNLRYLEDRLPAIWDLLVETVDELLTATQTLVATRPLSTAEREAFRGACQLDRIIDLSGNLRA